MSTVTDNLGKDDKIIENLNGMIKTWVLKVLLKNARLASSRVIRGGAFVEQVQWLMIVGVEKVAQEKRVTSYPPFLKILWIVDAIEYVFIK